MRIAEYIRQNLPSNEFEEKSNDEVVLLFREGKCSFDQVLLRYHYLMASRSNTFVFGMDADDIYQELAVKLYNCCYSWNPSIDASFSTYLSEACINRIRYFIRKVTAEKRKKEYTDSISLESLTEEQPGEENPRLRREPFEDFEPSCSLLLVGIPLTETEREYVTLVLAGLNGSEISKKVGVSRVWVSRVLRGLGKKLKAKGIAI